MQIAGFALVLVLRSYDMVGLPPQEVAAAERVAAHVLADARIEVSWIQCGHSAAPPRSPACDQALGPADLMVRLVSSAGQRESRALADATVDCGAGAGVLATVYVDRVARMAAASGVPLGTLLGRTIAHEAGHLLAGDSKHSRTGLMRAAWSTHALRSYGDRTWTFSPAEAQKLRERLLARLEARRAPRLPADATAAGY